MNPYRTNDLWCKKCLWHRCRCELVKLCGAQLADFERMIPPTQPPAQWYEIPELEVVDAPGVGSVTLTCVPQYRQTMTMDDLVQPEAAHDVGQARQLRCNALESVIEDLKERD